MKRIISLIVFCISVFFCHAELSIDQMKLRVEIVKALTSAGYNPNLDEDGDVFFTKDNVYYWVTINESWDDPFVVTLFSPFPYSSENGQTKENIVATLSVVNQFKTVKLYCDKDVYSLRTNILCKKADAFKDAFECILAEQIKAQNYIAETIASGLGGLDLTENKDDIFNRAIKLYENGEYYQAFKLFDFLARDNYPLAYSMLGFMYENGRGVTRNDEKMRQNYEKAIENGQLMCAYNLGAYYYGKRNYPKAIQYLKQCSDNDNPSRSDAYFLIGKMYENGEGVERDRYQAIQNYRKSVEYSSELESDGRMALMRLGQPVEDKKNFVDIPKSLLNGLSSKEMYSKGYEYENGTNNRSVSLAKAYGYYKAAVEADKDNAEANLKMGEIFISKFYPFNEKEKSDSYYSKAAKLLKKQVGKSAAANYQLGMLYKNGLGVKQDLDLAMSYFQTAANGGNAEANYELGLIYKAEDERVEAFNYFEKAAEKGCAPAMLEVAKAYEAGKGVSLNRDKAISWYVKCENAKSSCSKEASEALNRMGRTDDEKE